MNLKGMWSNLTPWTKRIIIITLGVICIALIVTGQFTTVIELFQG